MRCISLLCCCLLLAAADLPPAGTVLAVSAKPNSSIEFRAADGSLRPAIFTAAAGTEPGKLTSTGSGLDGSFTVASTALSLVAGGDRARHLLGETITEQEVVGKDGAKRKQDVAPEVQVAITAIGAVQKKGEGKDARMIGNASATLTLAGRRVDLKGEVRVSPAGKDGADGVDLVLSFTCDGAELGLKRDAQVPVRIDIYTRASPPPAPAQPKPKPKR
jgi:hypothetical protein